MASSSSEAFWQFGLAAVCNSALVADEIFLCLLGLKGATTAKVRPDYEAKDGFDP